MRPIPIGLSVIYIWCAALSFSRANAKKPTLNAMKVGFCSLTMIIVMARLAAKQALVPVRTVRPIISVRAVLEQLSAFAVLATPVTPRLGCAGLADQFFTREGVAADGDNRSCHGDGELDWIRKSGVTPMLSSSSRTSKLVICPSSTSLSYSSFICSCS